jgi:hypothetical protein
MRIIEVKLIEEVQEFVESIIIKLFIFLKAFLLPFDLFIKERNENVGNFIVQILVIMECLVIFIDQD